MEFDVDAYLRRPYWLKMQKPVLLDTRFLILDIDGEDERKVKAEWLRMLQDIGGEG